MHNRTSKVQLLQRHQLCMQGWLTSITVVYYIHIVNLINIKLMWQDPFYFISGQYHTRFLVKGLSSFRHSMWPQDSGPYASTWWNGTAIPQSQVATVTNLMMTGDCMSTVSPSHS